MSREYKTTSHAIYDIQYHLCWCTKYRYREAKNSFTLPGIGKLVVVKRSARVGRNPKTGETIQIPAKKVVKFRVAKAAKEGIL